MQMQNKHLTNSDRIFDIFVFLIMTVILLLVLYPLYFVIIASISDSTLVSTGKIAFLPKGIHLRAYNEVLKNNDFITGFCNSVFYTFAGTAINIALTVSSGYALSRRNLIGRKTLSLFITFTMIFNGGIIPTYFVMRSMNLLDTRWIMLLPGAVNAYNLIIARSFLENNIPEELYEAAAIDGCSQNRFFFQMIIPLSSAMIAVLALFYGVMHWNSYFNAMLYIKRRALYPLQLILREILIVTSLVNTDLLEVEDFAAIAEMRELVKYALVVLSSIPMMLLYPFVQKYFITGVMVGSIKG